MGLHLPASEWTQREHGCEPLHLDLRLLQGSQALQLVSVVRESFGSWSLYHLVTYLFRCGGFDKDVAMCRGMVRVKGGKPTEQMT